MGRLTRHRRLLVGLTTIAAFVGAIFACEVGLRLYHWFMAQRRVAVIQEVTLDPELGWRATENFSFAGELKDRAGNPYRAEVFTDHRGFRAFGNPVASDRPKVLFLGDSFTHAIQVSSGDAYFSLVGEALGCEVFAYGAGGYGTLQELMVLRDILGLVEPDAVVLQLCINDLYNNSYELELGSARNNNGLLRPYWEYGNIVYRLPRSFPRLRLFANEHSEFLYFLFSRLDRILASADRTGFEHHVAREGLAFQPFAESVEVTSQLLSMIRDAVPGHVPVFAFNVGESDNELEALRSSSEKAGLVFIGGVPEAIQRAEKRGICLRAADGGHWNPSGHREVSEVLIRFLAREWQQSNRCQDLGT